MPNCGEADQLSDDAWPKQREEADGCSHCQACHGNYSFVDWFKPYSNHCWRCYQQVWNPKFRCAIVESKGTYFLVSVWKLHCIMVALKCYVSIWSCVEESSWLYTQVQPFIFPFGTSLILSSCPYVFVRAQWAERRCYSNWLSWCCEAPSCWYFSTSPCQSGYLFANNWSPWECF